jgi:hypothetical protein
MSDLKGWLAAVASYDKEFKTWETRVKKIVERYADEKRKEGGTSRFNILWSNVQTIMPAVFARLPKPDVSRRFKDNDPVGRVAALLLERALEFEIDHYPDYRAAMENSVLDRFLGGRAVAWVRYEPVIVPAGEPEDGAQVTEDVEAGDESTGEKLEREAASVDYVHWKDFGHTPARTWEEVPRVWRKVYMKRPALIERFGKEVGTKIPLDTKPESQKNSDGDYEACIYEGWDKGAKEAVWFSKSYPEILDTKPDPLGLEQFWPCPRPLFGTLTTDKLVPTPDFVLYQDQANTLDSICDRIDGLIEALQVKGVHDASIPELARIFTEGKSGDMIGVKNWAAFVEKQGLKGAIDLVDLTPIFNALKAAYEAMEQQKAQVYEITGLSDIVRGQGDAGETATAQKLKGQYASLRLKSMQGKVSQYATELLQIKAHLMCKFYQPETLMKISSADQLSDHDKPMVEQAIQLLKTEPLSSFRIEVSADSLVQIDEDAEKEQRMEFLGAVGSFLKEAVQAPPDLMPLLLELLEFGVRGFKVGKTIEGAFDEMRDKIKEKAQQPPAPPPPDPAIVKAQLDQQTKQAQMAQDAQLEQQRTQADALIERNRMAMESQFEQQRVALEEQARQREQAAEVQMQTMQLQFDRWRAELDAATKIEAANIASKAKLADAATDTSTREIASEVRP